MTNDKAAQNTDKEIWRRVPGDFYSPSLHVTKDGRIGINVGGHVFVSQVEKWHEAMRLMQGNGWLPIKTAPKNGTLVLVSWRDHALVVAAVHAQADDYGRSWYGFVPALGLMMLRTPHFWMPLPSPPSKAEGKP